MELMLYGAVPFNLPEDSLAARRARKSSRAMPESMSLDRLVMLQVANEAAEAIQFILGPNHRPRPVASPAYRNPELKSYRCPPNTPNHKMTSFDFAATDADCSDLSTDEDDEFEGNRRNEDSSRKRRRLVSFSDSSASSRRVAHKKATDEKSGRKILARKKQENNLPAQTTSLMTDDDTVAPRLNFFAEVQRAVGEDIDEVAEQNWRKLGKSLRAIADRFGTSNNPTSRRKKQTPTSFKSIDSLPNGIWSAVISFVFWKIIKGYQ